MPKTLHRSALSLLALLAAFGPLTSEAQSRSQEKLLPNWNEKEKLRSARWPEAFRSGMVIT